MSNSSTRVFAGVIAAAIAAASSGALAQDNYGNGHRPQPYDPRYENSAPIYDYAKVIDVQPLTTRVRVSTPQRECWDETRLEAPPYQPAPRNVVGGTLLGAAIGGVLGSQIGSGSGRRAATAGGAVIGAAIGHQQAVRRSGYVPPPPREYTVQRCETRYREEWQERVDGYRVTYNYQGREQVTEMPYKPGDRIRVRVDVTPAES
jgi:uncharacterized protein YcfJ